MLIKNVKIIMIIITKPPLDKFENLKLDFIELIMSVKTSKPNQFKDGRSH